MSGGTFEGDWSEWRLTEVASRIEEENPLFGKLLMDVNEISKCDHLNDKTRQKRHRTGYFQLHGNI